MPVAPSMSDQADQAPFQVRALPLRSTAAQKADALQDTRWRSPPSTVTEAVHEVPFQVSARPLLSTAMQKLGELQDTAVSWPVPSMFVAVDHEVEFFQVRASPLALRPATQNIAELQDAGAEVICAVDIHRR